MFIKLKLEIAKYFLLTLLYFSGGIYMVMKPYQVPDWIIFVFGISWILGAIGYFIKLLGVTKLYEAIKSLENIGKKHGFTLNDFKIINKEEDLNKEEDENTKKRD